MSILVLLRHGESLWNQENRFTGWYDVDLAPHGEVEAKRAGGAQIRPVVAWDRERLGLIL